MTEPPMPEGPMPPMGGAPEPPMDEPEDSPEPPMDDEPMDEPKGENKEIDDIFGKLDTEKQAAVIKYAKSMVNDEDELNPEPSMDEPEDEPEMPMEGVKSLKNMISEIVNNILNDEDEASEEDREDDKIRNKKVTTNNPYISKR